MYVTLHDMNPIMKSRHMNALLSRYTFCEHQGVVWTYTNEASEDDSE